MSGRSPAEAKAVCRGRPLPANLSVVISGPFLSRLGNDRAQGYVEHLHVAFPSAQLILSTWPQEASGVDLGRIELVTSQDPGEDPFPDHFPQARNYSRMVISTAAGIARADAPFAIKARCEINFPPATERKLLELMLACESDRLLVSNWWTLRCLAPPVFHISDILQMGTASGLGHLWQNALQFRAKALIDRDPRDPASNEQLLWTSHFHGQGRLSNVLRSRNETSRRLFQEWRKSMRRDVLVVVPERLGITAPWTSLRDPFAPHRYMQGLRRLPDATVDVAAGRTRRLRHRANMLGRTLAGGTHVGS